MTSLKVSGGEQDLLIAELRARVEDEHVSRSIDGRHARRAEKLDSVLLIPAGGPDIPALEILI